MEEEWRDIKGFEGRYQISNLGRVKSLSRECPAPNGTWFIKKERILKPQITSNNKTQKMLSIHFPCYKNKNGKWKYKNFIISRLVAQAFLDFDMDLKLNICHLDGNTFNNCVENLKISTPLEKTQKAIQNGLFNARNKKLCKKILKYDKNGNLIKKYNSISEAQKDNDILDTNISRCAKNKCKTAGGYKWKYAED